MGSLIEDTKTHADWVANALKSSGYKANFSMESLKEIDRFFDEQSHDGQPTPGGLLSEQLGSRMFALGSYVGETIRRLYGGKWVANDNDPRGEINIEFHLPDGTIMWPVQRVMKRYKNGSEDGIHVYGMVAAEKFSDPPNQAPAKPGGKFGKKESIT